MRPACSRAWILLAAAAWAVSPAARAQDAQDPHSVITRATAAAPDIPGQAQALVALAWPASGPGDPLVQAEARRELVDYGEYALAPLRQAIKVSEPRWQADIAAAFVEAEHTVTSGQPADLLPGLDEAIWFGSSAARRVAIREMGRRRYPPGVLTIIDASRDDPGLTLTCVRALGGMGDGRARFFLGQKLLTGSPKLQREAALALAELDDAGLMVLRLAVRSDSRAQREAALAALLPVAHPEDADMVHRYVADHPDDDPRLLQRARDRGNELEGLLELQRDNEAASGSENEPGP